MYQIRIGRCSTLTRLDIDISIGPYYKAYLLFGCYLLAAKHKIRSRWKCIVLIATIHTNQISLLNVLMHDVFPRTKAGLSRTLDGLSTVR